METITVGQLLEAVHGTLLGGSQDMELSVSRVDTDSRDIHPGSLFIPLVGERFDGHAYITSALEAGAAGCLTARVRTDYREDKFYIQVGNTERALRDLAAADGIDDEMLRHGVFQRGCLPEDMPVKDYPADFIENLVDKWPERAAFIKEKADIPF